MILVAVGVVLTAVTCLVIYPALIVMLAAVMLECHRGELPIARVVRKRKTGRRFQRPAYQQVS